MKYTEIRTLRQNKQDGILFYSVFLWPLEGRNVLPDTRCCIKLNLSHQSLVGAWPFKLSGCWQKEPDSRTSCKFGPLTQTCGTPLCCGLLKEHRNIFNSLTSHFTPPREIIKGWRSLVLVQRACWGHSWTNTAIVFWGFEVRSQMYVESPHGCHFAAVVKCQTFQCFRLNWINSTTDFDNQFHFS